MSKENEPARRISERGHTTERPQDDMPAHTPMQAAFWYADRDWSVFPCHSIRNGVCTCRRKDCGSPGKHPRTQHGLNDATIDDATVRAWWTRWPDANIGLVTGAASGFIVLDIDPRHGGDASLARAVGQHGVLPKTIESVTGGGGRHLFFCHPGGEVKNRTNIMPGVDVRADSGYAIAPQSVHISGGRYEWVEGHGPGEVDLATLPDWLSALLTTAPNSATTVVLVEGMNGRHPLSRATLELIADGANEGERNDRLFRAAADFAGCGYTLAEAFAKLTPATQAKGLSAREIERTVRSAFSRPRNPSITDAARQWEPFPVVLIPSPIQELVKEGAAALGCEPAMVAPATLAVCAGAVGLTRKIVLKESWLEYPTTWTAVVALSGTLKSPAQDLAVGPLLELQGERFREYEQAREEWQREHERYEAERGDWRKAKPDKRGNPPEKPAEPTCVRHVTSDATVEALAPILQENPRGVLLVRDELGGWLRGFNQYKGGKGSDLQSWLELHRGGPLLVDRKTGRKTIHVPRAAVSVTGTIQPDVLQSALTLESLTSGLAARLLFVMPPRRDKRWSDRVVSPGTLEAYAKLLRSLLDLEWATNPNGEPQPVVVPLSSEALALWIGWYDQFARIQAETTGPLAASLSKLEAYAARFALLFHLVRAVAEGRSDTQPVDVQDVDRGTRLVDWFAAEQARVYETLRVGQDDGTDRESRELVDLIQARGGRVTVRELGRASRTYRGRAAEAEMALDNLVRRGFGRWDPVQPGPRGGAPTRCFVLASGGDGANTHRHAIENEGSGTVTGVDISESEAARPNADAQDDSDRLERKAIQAVEREAGLATGSVSDFAVIYGPEAISSVSENEHRRAAYETTYD